MPSEGDDEFLRSMGERLEGFYPGIYERLERLASEQLGRAIIFPNSPEETARGENRGRLVGYILPTRHDQREHVLLFRNGLVLVSELDRDSSIDYDKYKRNFAPSERPFDTAKANMSIETLEKALTLGIDALNTPSHHWGCRITLRSSQPTQMPQILEKVDQATLIAIETRTTRENVKEIIKKLDSIFEPPQELPPQAPQQQY